MRGIIYKFTFPDGKVYIGQTRRNPEKRLSEHLNELVGPKNSGFWEAYKKYGKFEYEEIWEAEDDDEDALVSALNTMETSLIIHYKAYDPQYGYNKRIAGTVRTNTNAMIGRKRAELKKSLLDTRLKDYHSAFEKVFYTREPLTKEEKYLIVKKYHIENLMRIKNYNFNNLKDNIHNEETEFALEAHFSYLHFLIENEVDEELDKYMDDNYDHILNEIKEKRTIVQMDKDGNVLNEFNSLNDICQYLHINSATSVWNVLKGKQKRAYGYYWKYKQD